MKLSRRATDSHKRSIKLITLLEDRSITDNIHSIVFQMMWWWHNKSNLRSLRRPEALARRICLSVWLSVWLCVCLFARVVLWKFSCWGPSSPRSPSQTGSTLLLCWSTACLLAMWVLFLPVCRLVGLLVCRLVGWALLAFFPSACPSAFCMLRFVPSFLPSFRSLFRSFSFFLSFCLSFSFYVI